MKNLVFVLALLMSAPAMAKCRINLNQQSNVDISGWSKAVALADIEKMINDAVESNGYRLSSNDSKAKGSLTYSAIIHDGGKADVTVSFSYQGDKMNSMVTHSGVATSTFGARIDNQVAKYIADVVPACDE